MREAGFLIAGLVLLLAMAAPAVGQPQSGHGADHAGVLHVDAADADHCGDGTAGTPHCVHASGLAGPGSVSWPVVYTRPVTVAVHGGHYAAPSPEPPYRPPAHRPA